MTRSTSRWIVGVSVGGIVHIAIFWLVAVLTDSDEVDRTRRAKGTSLQYIGSDSEELSPVMKEQIMLFDPKPLMKPTRWNGANFERIDDYTDEGSAIFRDYEPIFTSDNGYFVESFGNSWRRAGSPRSNQLAFPFVVAKHLGREEVERARAQNEGVGLEVIEVGSGRTVFSQDFNRNVGRSILDVEETWESVEFLVQVVDSFQVGTPSTVLSSRFPEIDRSLSELMARQLLPKGLLRNGSYLVRISR